MTRKRVKKHSYAFDMRRIKEETSAGKMYSDEAIGLFALSSKEDAKVFIEAAFASGIEYERTHQWYPCDGDYLPKYDVSVIVRLVDEETGEYWGETFMHRSDNPMVVKDADDWAKVVEGFRPTHWCYIPNFYG